MFGSSTVDVPRVACWYVSGLTPNLLSPKFMTFTVTLIILLPPSAERSES